MYIVSFLRIYSSVLPGFYCNIKVKRNRNMLKNMSHLNKGYSNIISTGDIQTIAPFLFFSHSGIDYTRYWVPVDNAFGPSTKRRQDLKLYSEVQEAVAVDFAFPGTGYNPDKPVYFILHGLNGGSNETYLLDFVHLAVKSGCTVAVMVARGMMETPVVSDSIFNGARLDDVHHTTTALRKAVGKSVNIIGVGYSMGGIILNNYACTYGDECPLDGAISLSSLLDCESNQSFKESQTYWEPILAKGLIDTTILPAISKITEKNITIEICKQIDCVTTMDKTVTVPYFGYK